MKIVENTPDRLTLEDFPWELAAWFAPPLAITGALGFWLMRHHLGAGALVTAIAFGFGLLLTVPVRLSRFAFSRASQTVEITTASAWSRRVRPIPLADVAAAEVETSSFVSRDHRTRVRLEDGRIVENPDSFRPILRLFTDHEKVPLHLAYTRADDREARALVEAMNAWLAAARES
jgi:hypothetical protein